SSDPCGASRRAPVTDGLSKNTCAATGDRLRTRGRENGIKCAIAQSAKQAPGRGAGSDAERQAIIAESRAALEILDRAVAPLAQLGGAAEMRPQLDQLRDEFGRGELAIEVVGRRRNAVIEKLLGGTVFAAGATLLVRARGGTELGYRALLAN